MALPMMNETTELDLADTPALTEVVSPWKHAGEPPEALDKIISEILGYDPQLIRSGTTTVPNPDALQIYEDLMMRKLGYVLTPSVSAPVQEALDEIDVGETTFAASAEEFDEHLRDLETDDI